MKLLSRRETKGLYLAPEVLVEDLTDCAEVMNPLFTPCNPRFRHYLSDYLQALLLLFNRLY